MVAPAHFVAQVLTLVVRVHVSDKAPSPATLGAGGLLLTAARHTGAVKLVTIICVHNLLVFGSLFVHSRSFVLPLYIRKEEQTHRNMIALPQNGRTVLLESMMFLADSKSLPSFTI